MELKINNTIKKFQANVLYIQGLLDIEIPQKQNGIAVAINEVVIPKSDWTSYLLKETDAVLIIAATQGG